jgi:hypothetical protein
MKCGFSLFFPTGIMVVPQNSHSPVIRNSSVVYKKFYFLERHLVLWIVTLTNGKTDKVGAMAAPPQKCKVCWPHSTSMVRILRLVHTKPDHFYVKLAELCNQAQTIVFRC